MRRAALPLLVLLLACGPSFYQAPPSLGHYPERVPAKRWDLLFLENHPRDPKLPGAEAMDEACLKLPESLAGMASDKRLAEIDRLLAENRAGDYSSRRANFLHELRELAADDALLAAAKDYLAWRVARWNVSHKVPITVRPWNMEEEEFAQRRAADLARADLELAEIDQLAAAGPPALKPYWLTRKAAYQFETRRFEGAAAAFETISRDHAGHPRAEAAGLMTGRCLIEQARQLRFQDAERNAAEIHDLLAAAEDALRGYIANYPKGRFTPDAHGWLGAAAFDRGQYGAAVKHQLDRLDLQPTREITRTVLRECDRVFEKLLESCEDDDFENWLDPEIQFDAAAVARHPLVARLFVQHCIDPIAHVSLPMWWDASTSGGRGTLRFLNRRILKPEPFIRRALTALGRELLAANPTPDPTTLLLLAWSATEEGEHEQSLALLDKTGPAGRGGEFLLARAVVLQRLGRHADAVPVLEALEAADPRSSLVDDLPYRKSEALFRSGQAGKAIAAVLPAAFPPQPQPGETPGTIRLHPHEQLAQWLDTLMQFAPLEQLEIALAECGDDPRHRELLANLLRTRAFAQKRFDLAEKHLSGDVDLANEYEWPQPPLTRNLRMTRAMWEEKAAPLAKLHADLALAAPRDAAASHLAIARGWMARRGALAMPSLSPGYYAGSEEEKQEQLRRRNALQLGFPREQVERELDHRDEAAIALEHALLAAKSADPAVAAPALELANECLFRRTEFSIYQKSRAIETDATAMSAALYQQLRGRFPESPEAKRAVFFTFTPPGGAWMPGDYNRHHSAGALAGALFGYKPYEYPEDENADRKIKALVNRLGVFDARTPLAEIRKQLEADQREFDSLRGSTHPEEQADETRWLNRIDDLRAAASLDGIRTEDFLNYAGGGFDKLPPAFASLLDFRDRVKPVVNEHGFETGALKNDTIDGWRAFLETYPDSPKAEAASFRMTRLIARRHRTSRAITAFQFPDAPIPNGYKRLQVERMDPTADPADTLAAIREHEGRFPQGRYRADLNLLRAGALIDSGNHSRALVLLDSVLSDPAQRDLHVIAALEFADIAQRLLDPGERAAVAKALRRAPGAMARLRLLVDGDTFLSRLKPLMPWLEGA